MTAAALHGESFAGGSGRRHSSPHIAPAACGEVGEARKSMMFPIGASPSSRGPRRQHARTARPAQDGGVHLVILSPHPLHAGRGDSIKQWEAMMPQKFTRLLTAFAGTLLAGTSLASAAEVTQQRLLNPEPQNWLMNHRTYDGQRFSPLTRIDKDNVKSLKLAYAVALGGNSVNENVEATPLVEDGFMYVVDLWGIVYKIDVRSGEEGR